MMTLEERNKLAEAIVETGGVWLLPRPDRAGGCIEVQPLRFNLWMGRASVLVMATTGKPFRPSIECGEGRWCRVGSKYKWVFPEYLEPVDIKEGVGIKE
ncbi:MAG TPA: hypothetical protein PKY64_09195 [Anaerolineaceae bacterium]|nr:hypothetical protein [Anaerolineaceae bacterium]